MNMISIEYSNTALALFIALAMLVILAERILRPGRTGGLLMPGILFLTEVLLMIAGKSGMMNTETAIDLQHMFSYGSGFYFLNVGLRKDSGYYGNPVLLISCIPLWLLRDYRSDRISTELVLLAVILVDLIIMIICRKKDSQVPEPAEKPAVYLKRDCNLQLFVILLVVVVWLLRYYRQISSVFIDYFVLLAVLLAGLSGMSFDETKTRMPDGSWIVGWLLACSSVLYLIPVHSTVPAVLQGILAGIEYCFLKKKRIDTDNQTGKPVMGSPAD